MCPSKYPSDDSVWPVISIFILGVVVTFGLLYNGHRQIYYEQKERVEYIAQLVPGKYYDVESYDHIKCCEILSNMEYIGPKDDHYLLFKINDNTKQVVHYKRVR